MTGNSKGKAAEVKSGRARLNPCPFPINLELIDLNPDS